MRKRLTLLIATLSIGLLVAAPASAQEPAEQELQPEGLEPGHERMVGFVMEIHEDDFFLLRNHDDGLVWFEIPDNPEVWDDLKVGDRVTVWFDPDTKMEKEGKTWYAASGSKVERESSSPSGESTGA